MQYGWFLKLPSFSSLPVTSARNLERGIERGGEHIPLAAGFDISALLSAEALLRC
jgi:hypothetical protein